LVRPPENMGGGCLCGRFSGILHLPDASDLT